MIKLYRSHKSIYLFIITLSLIGFITGFLYYKTQTTETKSSIKTSINIEEDLKTPTNNITKYLKQSFIIFILSLLIIPELYNIIQIFIKPFELGFIFSFLLTYNFKLAILYTLIYQFIPLVFTLILIRLSINISYNILNILITKNNQIGVKTKKILKKYLLIVIFLIFYNFLISLFSTNINSYLMTII